MCYHEYGDDAYSYATCIRTRRDDGTWILNVTHYSTTTSRHRNQAARGIPSNDQVIKVEGIRKGASASDLRLMALL